jgi:hypothetical protein
MHFCVSDNPDKAVAQLQSGTLSHAQIADTLQFLKTVGYSTDQLATVLASRDYMVRHYTRVSQRLDHSVKALLHRGALSFSHARAIASLPAADQEEVARSTIASGQSVARMRARLDGKGQGGDDEEHTRYLELLAQKLAEQTGLMLNITSDKHNRHAGTVLIRYSDLRDFDAICSCLNVDLSEE